MTGTIVIGAGVAGLAAAAELAREGHAAIVLEARDRIGGRCWSLDGMVPAVPIELGAEFVHGDAEPTMQVLQRAGIPTSDAPEARWVTRRGRLQSANDLFEELMQAFARARSIRRRDLSFAEFLGRQGTRALSAQARQMAMMMVEGLDAADPARVSAREIVEEWSGDSVAGSQSRPMGGYREVVRALREAVPSSDDVRLAAAVETVRWRASDAVVEGHARGGAPFSLRAKRIIVTVPLGVLQRRPGNSGAIRFDPPLSAKQWALEHLASGPVIKLVLRFRSAFWERIAGRRYRDAAFFHDAAGRIPTFWTALPVRLPILVAWAGGPKAQALAGHDRAQLVDVALQDLRRMFKVRIRFDEELQASWFHDWQADPHARGAYSYVTVDGRGARRRLAEPTEDTLFFAGEATDFSGEAATVAGAIASGVRAAREVLGSDVQRR